jgi:hypothetical protein|tara:strand:- start:688 stop:1362 length:675 start_codon:yes stop_codon:yes gene_type:complete
VVYESINVAEDERGLQQLRVLGARSVPVVSNGNSFVYAQDLNEISRFVGLDYRVSPELPAEILVGRLANVIDTASVLIQQIPSNCLQDKLPGRDRTYLALANHIFEIAGGFLQVAGGADFTGSIAMAVPREERTPNELNAFGRSIISDLNEWWMSCSDPSCVLHVTTFYGPQTLHAVLERCTWHATQHVRQVVMILTMHDVEPDRPLTAADLAGLPLPDGVWDG